MLDTYTNLQAEIAALLNRGDLTAQIPTWIALVEAEVGRVLEGRDMRTSVALTFDTTGTLTLPSDFVRANFLTLETQSFQQPIAIKPYDYVVRKRGLLVNGAPLYAAIVGNQVALAPIPDSDTAYTGTLWYDQALAALSSTNATNWLLTKHPDVYLYGSALHSAPYLNDDARIPVWEQFYQRGLDQIRVLRDRAEYADWNTPIVRPVSALGA